MEKICGGSGMGLKTAKFMRGKTIILSGRTVSKLEHAVQMLAELGIKALPHACDTSGRSSVRAPAEFAASQGRLQMSLTAPGSLLPWRTVKS